MAVDHSFRFLRIVSNLVVLAALFDLCAGGSSFPFVRNAASFPSVSSDRYDFIIVGGGTAGCPLAATLSQRFKVLVLERGGILDSISSNEDHLSAGLLNSGNGSRSPIQTFTSEEGVGNLRARVLGGGSVVNLGFYTRINVADIRKAGWDEQLVKESFEWVEKAIVFPPKLREWQATLREGLLEAGVLPDNGFTLEDRTGTKTSGSIFDSSGNRHSAMELLAYSNYSNIDVLLFATVHRILFKSGKGAPEAYGVEYLDENGGTHTATLAPSGLGDVILSAGALGSPQLLLLSGIGPAQHLRSFNILPILNLPSVGKGMADNPAIRVVLPFRRQVEYSLLRVVGKTIYGNYIEGISGGDSNFVLANIDSLSILPPSQRTNPEAVNAISEKVSKLKSQMHRLYNRIGMMVLKMMGPESRGTLELKSKDVRDNPSVRFNYFSAAKDMERCVKGMGVVGKVARSRAVMNVSYGGEEEIPEEVVRQGAELVGKRVPRETGEEAKMEEFCRETMTTLWHYHGGCEAGKVVSWSSYAVKGVKGLRVVDGSTLSATPGANPQATLMMLGRYVGIQILRDTQNSTK